MLFLRQRRYIFLTFSQDYTHRLHHIETILRLKISYQVGILLLP